MGTMPFFVFHLTNCSFLFQGMDYNTFMLSRRILKCTQILFPSLGPHVSVPFRAPSFPFFQFRQTSCSQPRGTVTISLYSLKRRLLDQSLPLHLLVNSLMEYGPFSFLSFQPWYKCLLEMQISVFWYFKHLNLFPQACSRRRVFYLFWDLAFSLNLPLLACFCVSWQYSATRLNNFSSSSVNVPFKLVT